MARRPRWPALVVLGGFTAVFLWREVPSARLRIAGAFALLATAIGLDFVRGKRNASLMVDHGFPQDKMLVAGVIEIGLIGAVADAIVSSSDSEILTVCTTCCRDNAPRSRAFSIGRRRWTSPSWRSSRERCSARW